MKTKLSRLIVLAALVLSSLLSACSSDDGRRAVDTLLFTNTKAEQAVYDYFCEPGNLSNPDCK